MTPDAILFAPADPMRAPASPTRIAQFMARPSDRLRKRADAETAWVCALTRLAETTRLVPSTLLRLYAALACPSLPPASISCRRPASA